LYIGIGIGIAIIATFLGGGKSGSENVIGNFNKLASFLKHVKHFSNIMIWVIEVLIMNNHNVQFPNIYHDITYMLDIDYTNILLQDFFLLFILFFDIFV